MQNNTSEQNVYNEVSLQEVKYYTKTSISDFLIFLLLFCTNQLTDQLDGNYSSIFLISYRSRMRKELESLENEEGRFAPVGRIIRFYPTIGLDDFKLLRNDRIYGRGGGVGLYFRGNLGCKTVSASDLSVRSGNAYTTEFLFVEIASGANKFLIGIFYNPPRVDC